MKKVKNKKIDFLEIVLRFFFGFLIPYIAINGVILFLFTYKPTIIVEEQKEGDYSLKEIHFSIESLLPLSNVAVFNDDQLVPYTKLANDYSIPVTLNGSYKIYVETINGMSTITFAVVNVLDDTPPTINLDNAVYQAETLIFTINDTESGINYDNVYAYDKDNNILKPTNIDKSTGTVQIKIPNLDDWTIHIEDNIGNSTETSFGTD